MIEYVLRDADLSDEEIKSGWVGGSDDGGIDGIFFFINRVLIQEETDPPLPAISVDLIIIQAKNSGGFEETAVEKIHTFTRDLLDYNRVPASLTYLSQTVRDAITNFRDKYTTILGSAHTLNIRFVYISKSIQPPNPKVLLRADGCKALVKTNFSAASVSFDFWGCTELLGQIRAIPQTQMTMDVSKYFTTGKSRSFVS